jgi:exo-1,4-beta-D-glucosaminidase
MAADSGSSERNDRRREMRRVMPLLVLILFAPVLACISGPAMDAIVGSRELTRGWAVRSANDVTDSGATVSRVGYDTAGWYPVMLPSTVLAGLVADGAYDDIYIGTNLRNVPDLTTQQWWYRGGFTAPAIHAGQRYWLRFEGISYRAEIWLNGVRIDADAVGSMVVHEYDVTDVIRPGARNVAAILVQPPRHDCGDLSFCTVDWNPEAPDMNAGIWGDTFLQTTGPVALRDPYVETVLPLPRTDSADLSLFVDAVNATNAPVTTTISGRIEKPGRAPITISQTVTLNANERREITFEPSSYPELHVERPALWWPYQFGAPELYRLSVTASVDGATSAATSTPFGIRQFTDDRTTVRGTSFARYAVNGRPIFIRGGGYVWDMLQRLDAANAATTVQYVRGMGLNTIRLEGTLGNRDLYDEADRAGVMIMPGFVCCSAWEDDKSWTPEQTHVAYASLDSQMRALRAHPSAFVWAFGSDCPANPAHLAEFHLIADALQWQNPTLDSVATWCNSDAGMKMDGPYVWEPPVLWWDTARAGSAFGTTAEEGTQSPPSLETLRTFIPPEKLWPIGGVWNFHAGKRTSVFDDIHWFTNGLSRRYGPARGVADYSRKSELQSYENARAFFEAWNSHEFDGCSGRCASFGVIYWMLDAAWPSMNWNLYSSNFQQGGAFFGAMKANEPVHIAYDYATRRAYVVNSTLTRRTGMTASAMLYDIPKLRLASSSRVRHLRVPADASTRVMRIPAVSGLSRTYLIRLRLQDRRGAAVSDNLYWYSTTADLLVGHASWYSTPVRTYADLRGLNRLPTNTEVKASASRSVSDGQETVRINLENRSTTDIAFFLRPEIAAGPRGPEVLPIDYSTNFASLFPGESTTIVATYRTSDLGRASPRVRLRGYNVPTVAVPIRPASIAPGTLHPARQDL